MDLIGFVTTQVHTFVLILVRVFPLLAAIPFVGNRNVPPHLQIGLAGIVAALLWPVLANTVGKLPTDMLGYSGLVVREVAIGLIIGFATSLVFNAIYLGGQMIDMQMGFGIVNVIDPLSNIQIPIAGQFLYLIAILAFMAVDGHHWFLGAIVDSYRIIPIGEVQISQQTIGVIWEFARQMWLIAFKIAAPILGMLFLSTAAMGIVARTVPQMNVFIVGFPLQIALGLFMLAVVLPMFYLILHESFMLIRDSLVLLLRSMSPSG